MEAISFADWQEHRYYIDTQTQTLTGKSTIHSEPKEQFANTMVRLAADYDLTEKTKTGVSIRGSYHPNLTQGHISTENVDYLNNKTSYNNIVYNDGHFREDIMANAYLTHKFSKESSVDVNVDYLTFLKQPWQNITNTSNDEHMQPLSQPVIQSIKQPYHINVFGVKVDYVTAFKNGIKLESGFKSSIVTTDDVSDVRSLENNVWAKDTGLSNHFCTRKTSMQFMSTLPKI
jgi:hypothetical protein